MVNERLRRAVDEEARRLATYGPHRDAPLSAVAERLERQFTVNQLVETLAQFHGRAAAYDDPMDFARQVVTVILADFDVSVRR